MEDNPNIGHNSGEHEQIDAIKNLPDAEKEKNEKTAFTDLQDRADALKEVGGMWLKAEDRKVIADQPTADKLATFLKQCQQLRTASGKQKKLDKQPSIDEGRVIEAHYKDLVAIVTKLEGALKPRLTVFEVAKQKVIQDERDEAARVEREAVAAAQRLAAEAEVDQSLETIEAAEGAQQAADTATDERKEVDTKDTSTRDVVGGRAHGLKKTLSAAIVDYDKALEHFSKSTTVRELIQSMANSMARGVGVQKAVEGEEVCPGVIMRVTQTA